MLSNLFLSEEVKEFAFFAIVICVFKCILSLLRQLKRRDKRVTTPENLSSDFLMQAYQRYASHNEKQIDLKEYIQAFPVQDYSLFEVNDFAHFYLDEGPDYTKDRLKQGLRWEDHLTSLMKQHVQKDSNVLDIGAHIGTHAIYLAQLLTGQGTVWAFEPQRKLFVELNANLAANRIKNVKTFRYAIGEKLGSIEMNATTEGNEGATSIGKGGDKAPLVTIDSFGIQRVSFIKIDVEGYEERVLAGAVQTIMQSKPVILMEIMCSDDRSLPEVKAKVAQITGKLERLGYQISRVGYSDYLALPT